MAGTSPVASLAKQADEVAAGVLKYLGALPPTAWAEPSDCAGWTVAGLVGHLILVEALLGGSINRGLQGDSGPPPQAAAGLDGWRAYRTREIARLSGLPPAELLARFEAGLGSMREPLARLAAAETSAAGGWHPMGVQPLLWFPGQWLVEIALHDWDLRVAADPAARVAETAWPGLGPQMRARMVQCFKPEQAAGLSGAVRIDLGSSAWLARARDGALEILDDGADRPQATIRTDPGTYALVQTRRRPAADFKHAGRWRVEGDLALADRLAEAFAGY